MDENSTSLGICLQTCTQSPCNKLIVIVILHELQFRNEGYMSNLRFTPGANISGAEDRDATFHSLAIQLSYLGRTRTTTRNHTRRDIFLRNATVG
jgi:hypothetical protein